MIIQLELRRAEREREKEEKKEKSHTGPAVFELKGP